MDSRKRLWRDSEGNIVSKRPTSLTHQNVLSSKEDDIRSGPDLSNQVLSNTNTGGFQPQQQLSPPRSLTSSEPGELSHQQNHMPNGEEAGNGIASSMSNHDTLDFLANSTWYSQPFDYSMAPQIDAPDDDMFNPDTASSFNMPFTTMNNYNWLFDRDQPFIIPAEAGQQHYGHNPSELPHSHNRISTPKFYAASGSTSLDNSQFRQSMASEMWPQPSDSQPIQGYHRPAGGRSTASASSVPPDDESPSLPSITGLPSTAISQTSLSDHSSTYQGEGRPRRSKTPVLTLHPQNFRPTSSARKLPVLDEYSRNRILQQLARFGPGTPLASLSPSESPLLSLQAMQRYSDLFFTRFNTCYPLIHQATFDPNGVDPLFLLSVLLLGATYAEKDAHGLAVCIHEAMRPQIFQHPDFTPQPELWILQTILLVECFGKSRAGQRQHNMAHLFHGLLVNLIRRSGCQTVREPDIGDDADDLQCRWRKAMDIEQRKRLAFLCFLWDTQHAVLFSQSLCISAFELRTFLPCSPQSWEADTAENWFGHAVKETRIPFLSVLKTYMNPNANPAPPQLNALSRLLVLHGLMSIQWDLKRRDQTSLGIAIPMVNESQSWQMLLAQAYDSWKADFDTYCMNMTLSLMDQAQLKNEFIRFSTATNAIYHAAHIILHVEILDLQIYAGAQHIIGRPVTPADYARSRRVVKQWAKPGIAMPATKAAWHAAQLLRAGIMNLDNWDVDNAFHYPWCLYLATLTCWAFHFAGTDEQPEPPQLLTPGSNRVAQHSTGPLDAGAIHMHGHGPDIFCDEKADMTAMVSGMTNISSEDLWRVAGKYSTSGLTAVMARHLGNIRWAVVHEGMKVLKGITERSK
ncbi:hypothetical protein A1O3_08403 [Capronia epimyces CBS 606.96]|uniref:Xylanolytic transcriptional activator regulatory domain-containing protein n=1 Tax=Capronia epimyces CBS 606.96 TaxID=1182542 RepID=W9XFD0_9EURO|nr:uncharacterized protein A1O3_08403 [Capronia epimyces CBS 606.96]EXJ78903.1 hypothetical protein A1O3_08403 [Capronia epimyces CBS 606.96]